MVKELLRTLKRSFSLLTILVSTTTTSTTNGNNIISTPRCTTSVDLRNRTSTFASTQLPAVNITETSVTNQVCTRDSISTNTLVKSYSKHQEDRNIIPAHYSCSECKLIMGTQISLIELLWFSIPCNHNTRDEENTSTDSDVEITSNFDLIKGKSNDITISECSSRNYESHYGCCYDLQSYVTKDESEASVKIDCKAFGIDPHKFGYFSGMNMKSDKFSLEVNALPFYTDDWVSVITE